MYQESPSFYYHPTAIAAPNEVSIITELFAHYIKMCAESKASEYLDLNNYTQKRSVHKCRAFLRSESPKPFEFSVCLN
jgi:hypothetical protein